jgi:hypothetical protein
LNPRAPGARRRPHVCFDGKTARGSRDGEAPAVHLVSAYAPEVKPMLAQLRVDAKINEHKAALQLLGVLPLGGGSSAAMRCSRIATSAPRRSTVEATTSCR